jgi:predicted sulfurtransferase
MRVAREGLNCTLTGPSEGIRGWCADLRKFDGGRGKIDPVTGKMVTEFANTEFKLTDDLPPKQRFSKLHAFEVVELVNYGLAGGRAPQIGQYGGTHLEPEEYHKKMCEEDTVIIDVRNHYEANVSLSHVVAVSCIALQLTVFGTFIDWTI